MRSGMLSRFDERFEPDAAGYDEDQRAIPDTLQHPAQPAQEPVNPSCAVVIVKHSFEEDRQLVDDEECRLVLRGTIAQQLLSVMPPASGGPARRGSLHENHTRRPPQRCP